MVMSIIVNATHLNHNGVGLTSRLAFCQLEGHVIKVSLKLSLFKIKSEAVDN